MLAAVDHPETVLEIPTPPGATPQHWTEQELAAMSSLGGAGRILMMRPGHGPDGLDRCLRRAGYRVGRIAITRECTHLPQAAASFLPDVIYVSLAQPIDACVDALEVLSSDPRTADLPLVAVLDGEVGDAVIEEAYARSGCDFLRLGSHVELLARTHLLVRLSGGALAHGGRSPWLREEPEVANEAVGTRLDLRDDVTGVYSATYFRHRLQQEVARAHRYQRPLALLAVRCVGPAGDDAAARLATILEGACRNVDLVARIEHDLFAVLLPETEVTRCDAIEQRVTQECGAALLRCRIGRAGLGADGDDGAYSAGSLLRLACARSDG